MPHWNALCPSCGAAIRWGEEVSVYADVKVELAEEELAFDEFHVTLRINCWRCSFVFEIEIDHNINIELKEKKKEDEDE